MSRSLLAGTGAAVLAVAWSGLPARTLPGPFSAHMAAHIAVVAVAAPLLAAAAAGTRWDGTRLAPRLLSPIPASIAELAVVWFWHMPGAHHAASAHPTLAVAEQASFAAAGWFLWASCTGGSPDASARAAAGAGALLFTSMHMTLLGALFALTPRVLYARHGAAPGTLDDQHLGGVVMLLVGGGAYLLGGLWLVRRLLVAPPVAPKGAA